jgi:hypothetical protein
MYFLLLRKKGGARETYSEGGTYRVVKRKGKRPLERPRPKWEENIKISVQEIRGKGVERIDLAQCKDKWQAFVKTVMNLRIS